MLKIIPVGGYSEIGRNCTLILVDDEAVILDLGLHMENYINLTNDDDMNKHISLKKLIEGNAVPNLLNVKEHLSKVKAILLTHAHLDHVGAVPFVAPKLLEGVPVYSTHFTTELLYSLFRDEKIELKNKLIPKSTNAKFSITKNISVEFVNMTHSVPQTVMILIKTPYGNILYANDFKFDNNPTLGQKPNYKRLKRIGDSGNLKALIVDSLYADAPKKTPSEAIAKEMLKDVLLGTNSKGKVILITTFSSHIARLKSIIELGKKMNRKIVLMGRSLTKYVNAAEKVGLVNFSKDCKLLSFGSQIRRFFKKEAHPEKYLFVVTGHQGEPQSVLGKVVNKNWLRFNQGDHIIFSSTIIPVEQNFINRENLEKELKKFKVRIFQDVHVSGHAGREDLRDLVTLVKPEFILPAHGTHKKEESMRDLALEIGYAKKNIRILKNFQEFDLK